MILIVIMVNIRIIRGRPGWMMALMPAELLYVYKYVCIYASVVHITVFTAFTYHIDGCMDGC